MNSNSRSRPEGAEAGGERAGGLRGQGRGLRDAAGRRWSAAAGTGPARPGRWDAARAGWPAVAGRGREAVGCGGALSRGLPAFELGGGGGFEEEVQGVVVFVELTPVRCVTSVG